MLYTLVLPYLGGNMFQDPGWMPETSESIESYIYCFFLYIHMMEFNLQIRYSKRSTMIIIKDDNYNNI